MRWVLHPVFSFRDWLISQLINYAAATTYYYTIFALEINY
jgi:hypothetical protein